MIMVIIISIMFIISINIVIVGPSSVLHEHARPEVLDVPDLPCFVASLRLLPLPLLWADVFLSRL